MRCADCAIASGILTLSCPSPCPSPCLCPCPSHCLCPSPCLCPCPSPCLCPCTSPCPSPCLCPCPSPCLCPCPSRPGPASDLPRLPLPPSPLPGLPRPSGGHVPGRQRGGAHGGAAGAAAGTVPYRRGGRVGWEGGGWEGWERWRADEQDRTATLLATWNGLGAPARTRPPTCLPVMSAPSTAFHSQRYHPASRQTLVAAALRADVRLMIDAEHSYFQPVSQPVGRSCEGSGRVRCEVWGWGGVGLGRESVNGSSGVGFAAAAQLARGREGLACANLQGGDDTNSIAGRPVPARFLTRSPPAPCAHRPSST